MNKVKIFLSYADKNITIVDAENKQYQDVKHSTDISDVEKILKREVQTIKGMFPEHKYLWGKTADRKKILDIYINVDQSVSNYVEKLKDVIESEIKDVKIKINLT